MKRAKEYYADVFEGIRLSVCGAVMLGVCGLRSVASVFRRRKEEYQCPEATSSR